MLTIVGHHHLLGQSRTFRHRDMNVFAISFYSTVLGTFTLGIFPNIGCLNSGTPGILRHSAKILLIRNVHFSAPVF